MTIEWQQGLDEHTWNARIGDVYKLRVFPGIGLYNNIHYHAQVCNVNLDELAIETNLPTVEVAKQRAVFHAWEHNNAVSDTLLMNV